MEQAQDIIEVPPPERGRRRRFSDEEKRRMLDEATRPGETLSSVGRRYSVSVALLFRWRRQLLARPAPPPRRTRPTDGAAEQVRLLRGQLRELLSMVGYQALELERLREQLASRGPTGPTDLAPPATTASRERDV